jgi:hypothetical protein
VEHPVHWSTLFADPDENVNLKRTRLSVIGLNLFIEIIAMFHRDRAIVISFATLELSMVSE